MESIEQLCQQLGGDQVRAYQARKRLAEMAAAAGAPGKEAERAALAAELAMQLNAVNETKNDRGRVQKQPRYSPAVRGEVARTLASVGGEAEVPALAEALKDFDVREMARWALDRMACAAATAALADAAQQAVGVEFRVGAINALGRRSGPVVVAALKKYASHGDPEIRMAAAEALANLPDASSDPVIEKVSSDRSGNSRATKRMAIARLRLADTLARAGQKDAAATVYRAVESAAVEEPQKKAAHASLEKLG
jgi:HEAT repeat protein